MRLLVTSVKGENCMCLTACQLMEDLCDASEHDESREDVFSFTKYPLSSWNTTLFSYALFCPETLRIY